MSNSITKKHHPFSQIPNELINDEDLKPAIRFTFVYLYSKPDNWTFFRKNISKSLGINIETLDKYLSALEERGWIKKTQKKAKDGTFGGMEIELFYERSAGEKTPIGSDGEKTRTGKNRDRKNHDHNNTDSNNTDLKIKTESRVIQKNDSPSLFPDLPDPKKESTFKNSAVADFSIFEKKFTAEEFKTVDIFYYFNAVKDWSLTKSKIFRTSDGWIATARNFMRRDKESNKLRVLKTEAESDDYLEYLKQSHGDS